MYSLSYLQFDLRSEVPNGAVAMVIPTGLSVLLVVLTV